MSDPPAHPDPAPDRLPEAAEIAELRQRVGRLERQLAQMVTTLSGRLTEHGRRLDALDQPAERRPGHDGR
jgi:hypothetical protein